MDSDPYRDDAVESEIHIAENTGQNEQQATEEPFIDINVVESLTQALSSMFQSLGITTNSDVLLANLRPGTPIRTVEELDAATTNAYVDQRARNFRSALAKYEALVHQIDLALETIPEDDPTNIREVFIDRKAEIETRIVVLKLTLGLVEDGTGDPNGRNNTRDELESALSNYKSASKCNFVLHLISLVLCILFFSSRANETENCDFDKVEFAITSYLPLGIIYLVYAVLQMNRIRIIKGDAQRLDLETLRLWPKGSKMDKVELSMRIVFLAKVAWFFFGLFLLFGKDISLDCRKESSSSSGLKPFYLFASILTLSCFDLFLNVLLCFLLPLLCCCLFFVFIHEYRHYLKKQPKGLKENKLRQLSIKHFSESLVNEKTDQRVCAICLSEFERNEEVRELTCKGKHLFHKECVDNWLIKNDTCPQCREHIKPKSKKKHKKQRIDQTVQTEERVENIQNDENVENQV